MKPCLLLALGFCLGASGLRSQGGPAPDAVRFDQRIGQTLPLSTVVIDVDGRRHLLRDFFPGRPVILYFGYARCPQLCAVVADGTVAALRQLRRAIGREIEVVTLSIDPAEDSAAAQARLTEAVHRYGDLAARSGWHYLRGNDAAIRAITDAAGFRFGYDPRSQQFAHPSGFLVVTPKGVISRYFIGVDFDPADLSRAVNRAGDDKTGESVTGVLLRCFRGDGFSGRYSGVIWRVLAFAVAATVVALAAAVGAMLHAEKRRRSVLGEQPP